jgi:hypothetical protein
LPRLSAEEYNDGYETKPPVAIETKGGFCVWAINILLYFIPMNYYQKIRFNKI